MTLSTAKITEQIGHDLLSVLPRLNRIVARELRSEAGDDPTLVQLRVLDRLAEEPMTLSELARRREISPQAASEHVQSLVERGWVVRIPDPHDRRSSLLRLTDEGERRLAQMRTHIAEHLSPMFARMTAHEAEATRQALLALRRILVDEE